MKRGVAILATILVAHAAGVAAQTPKSRPPPAAARVAAPAKPGPPLAPGAKPPDPAAVNAPGAPASEPPPPYEPKLLRLAEILGTLAYLRDLCGDGDAAEWRRRMSELVDTEGTTVQRKERLAGAFNRGFRGYQFTYHACTAAAETVVQRLLDEGERITRDVASRYAG